MRSRRFLMALLLIRPLASASGQVSDDLPATVALTGGMIDLNELLYPPESYAGRDEWGVPRYLCRRFTAEERRLLLEQFGIEDPSRLYLSDSSTTGHLVYDTERDPGLHRLVRSYRVGAPSVRQAGESWEDMERWLRTLRRADFPRSVRKPVTSLDSLHPDARQRFERMLAAARADGHRVRVVESRRSPERQAYLMVLGGGLTFTATSLHAAGHAVDIVVGDGDLRRARTRARWIAFRRWLAAFEGGRFSMIGTPDWSWDWPHVELADGGRGYRSVDALLRAARAADTACCDRFPAAVQSDAGGADQAVAGPGRQ